MTAFFELDLDTTPADVHFGEPTYLDFTISIVASIRGGELVAARIVDERGAWAPLEFDGTRFTVNALGLQPGYATLQIRTRTDVGNEVTRGWTVIVWPDLEGELAVKTVQHRAHAVVFEHEAVVYAIPHVASVTIPDVL